MPYRNQQFILEVFLRTVAGQFQHVKTRGCHRNLPNGQKEKERDENSTLVHDFMVKTPFRI